MAVLSASWKDFDDYVKGWRNINKYPRYNCRKFAALRRFLFRWCVYSDFKQRCVKV